MNPLILLLTAYLAYLLTRTYITFTRHLRSARTSGIHYIPVPVFFLHRFWLATHRLYLPLLALLPTSLTTWVDFTLPDFGFDYRHEIFARVGHDTFLTVAPGGLVLYTCEPPVISQICSRRNDFPKPTSIYTSVDIYGRNVVSSEGKMWRQHRKATSPPFTERNNMLVWRETISQAEAMVGDWRGQEGRGLGVQRVMDDTMRLSLHVISRAGFGRRLEWPTESKEVGDGAEKGSGDDGYVDPSKIRNDEGEREDGHSMSYTYAIHCLLDNILFQFLLPRWLLRLLPFKRTKKADEAYVEWGNYMREAVEKKRNEVKSGEMEDEGMDILRQLVKGQDDERKKQGKMVDQPLNDEEILGNMFVLILAGHETAANSIHFSMLYLALHPESQRRMQKDLDQIFQGRPPSEWDYDRDLPALFGGMVGAVLNEELRLVPPVIGIPKSTWGVPDQRLTVEGKECIVPGGTFVSLATPAAHRNPNYWPKGNPRLPGGKTAHPVSNLDNDLEEFRPERWLLNESGGTQNANDTANGDAEKKDMPTETVAGGDLGINEAADTSDKLYKPAKGAYLPFSDGYRSCLGRRFAQVEVLVALAVIYQNYSVELAVDKYASDAHLAKMTLDEKVDTWQSAAEDVRELMLNGLGVIITLQMRKGHVKLRLVKRGQESFPEDVDEQWKTRHPEQVSGKGVPGWRSWVGKKTAVHGLAKGVDKGGLMAK